LNILKLDRLKLETLNVIEDTIRIVKEKRGFDITDKVRNVDLSDQNLFIELRLGMNHGIFQFESPGMNALIRGMATESFAELTAANALYRPGPMGIGAHEEFIKNKFNPENIKYVHPALETILKETNGVLIYQEQLMFLANKIGGMSLGEGDMLRRYMDKASSAIMKKSAGENLNKKEQDNYVEFEKYWNKFIDGAVKNGYKADEVDIIKDWVIKYLGYSFNKCLTENHEVVSRDRGRIKILDAKIGENILTYNPVKKIDEFYPIKNKYDNGLKKVYRIKTSSGKILECTLDHKIMTEDGMKTLSEIIEKKLKIKTI
jgi:DNA polymerase-3 subunit alpha